jgi:transketolase
MTGDGELQEGPIWESLISAANLGMSEICALVDHNKLQSDTFVEKTSSLGDLEAKFRSFGWHVERVDGHDFEQLGAALWRAGRVTGPSKWSAAQTWSYWTRSGRRHRPDAGRISIRGRGF